MNERITLTPIKAISLHDGQTYYESMDGSFLLSKYDGKRRLRSLYVYVEDANAINLEGRLESQLNACEEHSMELAAYRDAWKELSAYARELSDRTENYRDIDDIAQRHGVKA